MTGYAFVPEILASRRFPKQFESEPEPSFAEETGAEFSTERTCVEANLRHPVDALRDRGVEQSGSSSGS